jgi:hypothetical protein
MRCLVHTIAALGFVLVGGFPGCTTEVTRFHDDSSDLYFHIAGVVETETDSQFVRVDPLRPVRERSDTTPLDASGFLLDATLGLSIPMIDSLVVLDNGSIGHLMVALYRPAAGHRYQVKIVRSDGAFSLARTSVPNRPDVTLTPAHETDGVVTAEIAWSRLTRLPDEAFVYYVVGRSDGDPPVRREVTYATRGRLDAGSWKALLRLSDDLRVISAEMGLPGDGSAVLYEVGMTIRILGSEWGRQTDNVENGVGKLASIGRFSTPVSLADEIVNALGFTPAR